MHGKWKKFSYIRFSLISVFDYFGCYTLYLVSVSRILLNHKPYHAKQQTNHEKLIQINQNGQSWTDWANRWFYLNCPSPNLAAEFCLLLTTFFSVLSMEEPLHKTDHQQRSHSSMKTHARYACIAIALTFWVSVNFVTYAKESLRHIGQTTTQLQ